MPLIDRDNGAPEPKKRLISNPLRPIFAKHQSLGTILEADMVTTSMKRLVIRAEAVSRWDNIPGQHVRIQMNDPLTLAGIVRPADTLRTYTVWDTWPTEKTFEIRAHLFDGDGIGRHWISQAQPGDQLTFWGPMGAKTLPESLVYLFIGDETAAAGSGQLARSLAGNATVLGIFESESPEHDMPMEGFDSLTWVHRRGGSPVGSPTLVEALRQYDLPHSGVAYIAGEAKTGQTLRQVLMHQKGWERSTIIARPFWTPGKRGLHH